MFTREIANIVKHLKQVIHSVATISWEEMEDNLLFIELKRLSFEQSGSCLHVKETCWEGHVLLAHCACMSVSYIISSEELFQKAMTGTLDLQELGSLGHQFQLLHLFHLFVRWEGHNVLKDPYVNTLAFLPFIMIFICDCQHQLKRIRPLQNTNLIKVIT